MNFDAGFKKVPLDYATTNSMNSGVQPNVQNTEESDCLFSGVETNCPGVDHSITITQPFDVNRDVDSQNLDSLKAFFGLPADAEVDMSKVSVRSDGQITDFYVDGKRYSLRYDSEGNINKVLEMEFDENGNVTNQKIRNYNIDGALENTINYEYTSDGGQTRTARHARYGNPMMLMGEFFGGANYSMTADKFTDQKFDSDGRLTDFYYEGKRYSVRYDSKGQPTKTIVQTFHENGTVATQSIKQKGSFFDGLFGRSCKVDFYTYDEDGNESAHVSGYSRWKNE
ncbi:hypothetical protein IJE86_11360 [bacterium]|nr:hypothetical protein [bacterium]